ncbi:MAG: DUF885 domain-containing protein [Enterobacterales bacterium]|nr:DUF885 domain-containing protein [Enterobacterales bacterium]
MNMKNINPLIAIIILATFFLSACESESTDKPSAQSKSKINSKKEAVENSADLKRLFNRANSTFFKNRVVTATQFGVSEALAGFHYQSEMNDYSTAQEADFRAQLRGISNSLKELSTADAGDDENRRVVADIIDYFAGDDRISIGYIDPWMGHSAFLVNQINGPLIDIPNYLINSHSINRMADAEDYLERLEKFPLMIKTIESKLKNDAQQGWIPPKIILNKTIGYLRGFVKLKPAKHSLVTSFKQKLEKLTDLDQNKRQAMLLRAQDALEKGIYKGYLSVASILESYLDKATEESGIWAQPQGAEFYQYSIRKLADTDMSPDQIHQVGLTEVNRIIGEMDQILKAQGYSKGSVGERMTSLNLEDRFLYPNNDQGRNELLTELNKIIAQISPKMAQQFATSPKYQIEVKRIPVATQDTAGGGYYTPPAMDGSLPGIYWINLRDTKANPKFDLKTLTFHEAIPGHHWQVALNMEQDNLPFLRRIAPYNAYVEGWALYSEQIAYELGMYQDDPFGNLGRLKAELFRAVRLVVDTGLHAKKWSREKAIDYMESVTGTEHGDVVSEIERYMVWPGQALGYKLGMLKILSLRELAKKRTG